MELIVPVKQVPETTEVEIDPSTGNLIREGVKATLNPFDAYAVEEALRIRDSHGGRITVLSMGPPQAESAIRDAIALGCDRGILLSDPAFAGSDTLATSYTLATAIRGIGSFDLIICGIKTTDGDTGQVGPGIAEEIGIPHISYVKRIDDIEDGNITVSRTLDDLDQRLRSTLPCLITVTKEINEPRLPSFKGKMASRKAEIPVWDSETLDVDPGRVGSEGSPTWVVKVFHPSSERGGVELEGTPREQAGALLDCLRQRKLI